MSKLANIYIIYGASGTGKTTLVSELDHLNVKVTVHSKGTTRKLRAYDEDEIVSVPDVIFPEYDYIYANYGNKYGIQIKQIEASLNAGKHHFIICNDKPTIQKIKDDFPNRVRVIFMAFDMPEKILHQIQSERNISDDEINLRLEKIKYLNDEFLADRGFFDAVIINKFGFPPTRMLAQLRSLIDSDTADPADQEIGRDRVQLTGNHMAHSFTKIKVFFSSTKEMAHEKDLLEDTIKDINRHHGDSKGINLDLMDYKADAGSQIGDLDGQEIINETIKDQYEIYFGVLGQRFGSPTKTGETGTEAEFNIALESYVSSGKPLISFFFKDSPPSGADANDLTKMKEWTAVLEFKRKISGKGLYVEYKDDKDFGQSCKTTLMKFIDKLAPIYTEKTQIKVSDDTPNVSSHYENLKRKYASYPNVSELKGEIKFPSTLIADAGVDVVENLKQSGFVTYYAKGNDFWDDLNSQAYLTTIREKARQGEHITRIYILESIDLLDHKSFRNLLNEDLAAKIDTKLILQDDIGDAAKDFGLWDCFDSSGLNRIEGGIVCFVELGGHGKATGCRFSSQSSLIEEGISIRAAILGNERLREAKYVIESYEQESVNKIVPNSILHESISRMENVAIRQCRESYLPEGHNEEDCKWYHKAWQYLRLLGMVSTPEWHHDFFISELSKAIKGRNHVNILVSGLADYGMLAYVMKVCNKYASKHFSTSHIDVLDMCKTPLLISDWYQSKIVHVSKVRVFQCDARNSDIRDHHYEVIVTDAFLSRFDKEDRKKILSEWHRMLKTDGTVITTVRKRSSGDETAKASEEERAEFASRAKQNISEWKNTHAFQSHLQLDEGKIEKYANEYAENMTSHKMGEESDVRSEIEENNFEVVSCGEVETPGEYSSATYFQIVAKRRSVAK